MERKKELVKAIILLPGSALVLIPAIILWVTGGVRFLFGVSFPGGLLLFAAGTAFAAAGITFAFKTVWLFTTVGEGTPAPWAPPKRFVVAGPYRHVRNPMILSVLSILLAEAIFFGSFSIFVYFVIMWLVNTVYFALYEEPSLEKRFGSDYVEYKKNVRRWIPRLKPWNQK